ncbi:hypothetical protein HanXRQr2_Chr06g0251341 [Helianthus annuus]|uniref:Uncharacterized protein n=1 Tax=Helianthus annuus TaxID=4232 RepID=A0A251UJU4_HELAN|nr:hypothetical protein HanXRQr2_Chr06g0251341 [Helianthus annuus]KAJ0566144.1 hypothetical protein HanIR_Chr06g0270501 [Helianthus annuus]KAJ0572964.1 hypothetical protein HanHA89_Chr06g0221551 [Helianthus annuus]
MILFLIILLILTDSNFFYDFSHLFLSLVLHTQKKHKATESKQTQTPDPSHLLPTNQNPSF